MNISFFRARLRKGHTGRFRRLRAGELIEAADVAVYDTWMEHISESNIGQPCGDKEIIMRMEFEK